MTSIPEEIYKRWYRQVKEPWPERPPPITWEEYKRDIVIDWFLQPMHISIGFKPDELEKAIGLEWKQISPMISELIKEEFLITKSHFLMDDGLQYYLNVDKTLGQEELEAIINEQAEKEKKSNPDPTPDSTTGEVPLKQGVQEDEDN